MNTPAVLATIAALTLAPTLAGCSASAEDQQTTEGFVARNMCRDFVKEKLGVKDADFSDEEQNLIAGSWTVNGTVTSPAATGPVTCVMTVDGDNWTASKVLVP